MIQECLTKLRSIPKRVTTLKKLEIDVEFADLKPGIGYQSDNDQIAIWAAKSEEGFTRLDFGDKKGEKWSGTYNRNGLLHGEITYESPNFTCRAMALNGNICGPGKVMAKNLTWEFVVDSRTDTYIIISKQDDNLVTQDLRYLGSHAGFSTIYRRETGCLIKMTTYLEGREHGLQGTWFKDGQARRTVIKVHGIAHGRFTNFHFNGSPAEQGDLFLGDRTGLWTVWVVSQKDTPTKVLSNTYRPDVSVDWLSRILDDDGKLIELNKTAPPSVLVDEKPSNFLGRSDHSKLTSF